MLGFKSDRQTLLKPPGMRIPTGFLITGSRSDFQRAPVRVSAQSKEQGAKTASLTNEDLKFCFVFMVPGSPCTLNLPYSNPLLKTEQTMTKLIIPVQRLRPLQKLMNSFHTTVDTGTGISTSTSQVINQSSAKLWFFISDLEPYSPSSILQKHLLKISTPHRFFPALPNLNFQHFFHLCCSNAASTVSKYFPSPTHPV